MYPKNKIINTTPWTAAFDFASLYPSIFPTFDDSKYRKILRRAKLKKIQEFQENKTNGF